jgi:hypothetical protein
VWSGSGPARRDACGAAEHRLEGSTLELLAGGAQRLGAVARRPLPGVVHKGPSSGGARREGIGYMPRRVHLRATIRP